MTRPPLDLEAIRQRVEAANSAAESGFPGSFILALTRCVEDVPALLAEVERLRDGIAAIHYPVEVEPSETICAGCSTRRGSGDNVRFFPYVEWPCETATLHDEATP